DGKKEDRTCDFRGPVLFFSARTGWYLSTVPVGRRLIGVVVGGWVVAAGAVITDGLIIHCLDASGLAGNGGGSARSLIAGIAVGTAIAGVAGEAVEPFVVAAIAIAKRANIGVARER